MRNEIYCVTDQEISFFTGLLHAIRYYKYCHQLGFEIIDNQMYYGDVRDVLSGEELSENDMKSKIYSLIKPFDYYKNSKSYVENSCDNLEIFPQMDWPFPIEVDDELQCKINHRGAGVSTEYINYDEIPELVSEHDGWIYGFVLKLDNPYLTAYMNTFGKREITQFINDFNDKWSGTGGYATDMPDILMGLHKDNTLVIYLEDYNLMYYSEMDMAYELANFLYYLKKGCEDIGIYYSKNYQYEKQL